MKTKETEQKPVYLSRFLCCSRCDNKAEYTLRNGREVIEYLCNECAQKWIEEED